MEESLAMLRTLDERPLMAHTLARMSAIVSLQGDYERAGTLAAESMALFRALNEHEQIVEALFQLGVAAVEQGRADQAAPFLEQCIQIAREVDELGYLAAALNLLGMAELEQGHAPSSLERFHESLALFQQRDEKLNVAWTFRNLGLAELFVGAIDQADVHFKMSLALYREFGGPDGLAIPLEGLSGVAAARGQPRRSARLLGAAAGIRAAVGMPLSPNAQAIYTHMLEPATVQLDPAEWEAELTHGRGMSLEQVLLYAEEA
jgi:tetratricopeptide (TPR) repeat protein